MTPLKVIDLLSTSLNKRDEKANQELALEIIKNKRNDWIEELVVNLKNKDKNIQSDCIKVLYEIGENGAPEMISPYLKEFANLLVSKNNRLVWGAMNALDMIATVDAAGIYSFLPEINKAIDKGSVITIDHGVGVLAKLSSHKEYAKKTFPLLIEQLAKCPIKQLSQYAEKSIKAVTESNRKEFVEFLESRLSEVERDSQKSRIQKIIKTIMKKY